MYLPRGSVETGGARGFYRDDGAIMCGAQRAMSGEIGYLLVLTAGVVQFVGIGTWYDISACCSHRSRHS